MGFRNFAVIVSFRFYLQSLSPLGWPLENKLSWSRDRRQKRKCSRVTFEMGLIWNYFLLDAISTASGCSSTWHPKGQLLTSCLTWKSLWMDSLMVKTAILEVLVSGVSVGLHLSQNNTDNCLYRIYSLLRCLIIINITNVILCCKCQMSRLALSNIKDPLMAPRLETFSAASGQKSRSLKCFETNARIKEKNEFPSFLVSPRKSF